MAIGLLMGLVTAGQAETTAADDAAGAKQHVASPNDEVLVSNDVGHLDADSVALLQQWADRLRANARDHVMLEITMDAAGSPSLALALADRYLDIVREELTRRGVGVAQIQMKRVLTENDVADVAATPSEPESAVVRLIYEPSSRK